MKPGHENASSRSASRPVTRKLPTGQLILGSLITAAMLVAAGCGPVRLVATTNIPPPLVVKIPVVVALHVPAEFANFVHKEERSGTNWNVELGKAQSEGLTRLLTAMFERVVLVESINAGSQLGAEVRAILEPSIEEYAFVTPRDAGSPFFAVSIKYRVNVYSPDGRLADSWGFTGYGTAPAQGITSNSPLTRATALAMRDAGAKLAVEFREQAIVRGLLPETVSTELATQTPATASPPPGTTPGTTQPATQSSGPKAEPAKSPTGSPPELPHPQNGPVVPPADPQPELKPEEEKEPEPPAPESLV